MISAEVCITQCVYVGMTTQLICNNKLIIKLKLSSANFT